MKKDKSCDFTNVQKIKNINLKKQYSQNFEHHNKIMTNEKNDVGDKNIKRIERKKNKKKCFRNFTISLLD